MESETRVLIGAHYQCEGCAGLFHFSFDDGRGAMTTRDSSIRIEIAWWCPECNHKNTIVPLLGWPYTPDSSISIDDFAQVAEIMASILGSATEWMP